MCDVRVACNNTVWTGLSVGGFRRILFSPRILLISKWYYAHRDCSEGLVLSAKLQPCSDSVSDVYIKAKRKKVCSVCVVTFLLFYLTVKKKKEQKLLFSFIALHPPQRCVLVYGTLDMGSLWETGSAPLNTKNVVNIPHLSFHFGNPMG